MDICGFFSISYQTLPGILAAIIGLMSIIASIAPGVNSNPTWSFIRQVIDAMAFNMGNARNQKKEEVTSNEVK